jgi:hypothetical protein
LWKSISHTFSTPAARGVRCAREDAAAQRRAVAKRDAKYEVIRMDFVTFAVNGMIKL